MPNAFLTALAASARLQEQHPEIRLLRGEDFKNLVELLVPPEEAQNREAGEKAATRIVNVLDEIFSRKTEIPFDARSSKDIAKEVASVLFLDEPDKMREAHERLETGRNAEIGR